MLFYFYIDGYNKCYGLYMDTTRIGLIAEEAATNFLVQNGYKIIDNNWRTKNCEIDIVACRDKCVYFVEVKYRKQPVQGRGLDYITTKKLKQMSFAAEIWVFEKKWNGDYSLAAIEVSGQNYDITAFVTDYL